MQFECKQRLAIFSKEIWRKRNSVFALGVFEKQEEPISPQVSIVNHCDRKIARIAVLEISATIAVRSWDICSIRDGFMFKECIAPLKNSKLD